MVSFFVSCNLFREMRGDWPLFPFFNEVIIGLVVQDHFLQVIFPSLNVPIFTSFFFWERSAVTDKSLSPDRLGKLAGKNEVKVVLGVGKELREVLGKFEFEAPAGRFCENLFQDFVVFRLAHFCTSK